MGSEQWEKTVNSGKWAANNGKWAVNSGEWARNTRTWAAGISSYSHSNPDLNIKPNLPLAHSQLPAAHVSLSKFKHAQAVIGSIVWALRRLENQEAGR